MLILLLLILWCRYWESRKTAEYPEEPTGTSVGKLLKEGAMLGCNDCYSVFYDLEEAGKCSSIVVYSSVAV